MQNTLTMYADLLKNVFSGNNTADPGLNEQTIRHETEKISSALTRAFYGMEDEARQRASETAAGCYKLPDGEVNRIRPVNLSFQKRCV